jgi:hypothetical protein
VLRLQFWHCLYISIESCTGISQFNWLFSSQKEVWIYYKKAGLGLRWNTLHTQNYSYNTANNLILARFTGVCSGMHRCVYTSFACMPIWISHCFTVTTAVITILIGWWSNNNIFMTLWGWQSRIPAYCLEGLRTMMKTFNQGSQNLNIVTPTHKLRVSLCFTSLCSLTLRHSH